ncbi:MAG: hypothetical protein M0R80_07710 [Proteobacteria bacterium]|jgi:hypothetical protein|nr:hypothetical protein [Pseudomonadota bacterium]
MNYYRFFGFVWLAAGAGGLMWHDTCLFAWIILLVGAWILGSKRAWADKS